MSRSGPARVALVDPHDMFTESLGIVLEARGYRCERVVLSDSAQGRSEQLQARLTSLRPDVALINTNRGIGRNEAVLIETAASVGVAVVVLADVADEVRWARYLAAGARIVVPKSASLTSMVSVVRRLCNGESVLEWAERERLLALGNQHVVDVRRALQRLERLSAQEAAVLRALMAGLTVRDIAADRTVSAATVRTQVKAVLAKLEVGSQISAVALGHVAGWTPSAARPPEQGPPPPPTPDA